MRNSSYHYTICSRTLWSVSKYSGRLFLVISTTCRAFLTVNLQLHKWARTRRRRRGGGRGCPLPTGGGGCAPSPEENDFDSQYGEYWCILLSSATCFTPKTGVIWCPSPYFFLNFFASKRTWFIFFRLSTHRFHYSRTHLTPTGCNWLPITQPICCHNCIGL